MSFTFLCNLFVRHLLELILDGSAHVKLLVTMGVLCLMCYIAFGRVRLRTYAASVALTFGVGMLIGGIMTSAFLKLGNNASYVEIGGTVATVWGDLPIWKFALFALISALITWGLGKLFRRKRAIRTCILRVRFNGRERELTALVDSGNLLEDPVSGTPVIFLKEKAAVGLPRDMLFAMKNGVASLSACDAGSLRVIPTGTVNGSGIMLAAVSERVSLRADGAWESRRALIAVDFTGGDYGGFDALVPEVLF